MTVEHDPDRQRFFVRLGSYEACLMYARRGEVLDFYHIYVPDPYRNRGLAGRILISAFDYAAQNNLRVVPSCPFIAGDFLPRFEKYQPLVERGEFPFVSAV
jgi:uncharacterized protein